MAVDYSTVRANHVPKTKYEVCVASWDGGKCDRTDIAAFGLCFSHDRQLRRGGSIGPIRFYRPLGLDGRELGVWCVEHGSTEAPGGCRRWKYALSGEAGYPTVYALGRRVGGHRLVAWTFHSERESFLGRADVVHHKCHNRWCLEPDHLQIVTAAENSAEMLERTSLLKRISELESEVEDLRALAGINPR